MKDAYKDVMDAVKAPDALVEKTLNLMLAEHKNLEVIAERDAGFEKIAVSPKKTHWMTRVALPVAACLCLLVIVPRLVNREPNADIASVDYRTPSTLEAPIHDVHATESFIEARAIDNLATRSGPAIDYRETGTYQLKGDHVRLISLAYDEGGICWVQCEVFFGSKLRRVYTGIKRFDTATFDLASVPEEAPLDEQAEVTATSKALYGPGDGYDAFNELTVDEGQTVSVIITENEYAQVEWKTSKQSYRAWVPIHTLSLL